MNANFGHPLDGQQQQQGMYTRMNMPPPYPIWPQYAPQPQPAFGFNPHEFPNLPQNYYPAQQPFPAPQFHAQYAPQPQQSMHSRHNFAGAPFHAPNGFGFDQPPPYFPVAYGPAPPANAQQQQQPPRSRQTSQNRAAAAHSESYGNGIWGQQEILAHSEQKISHPVFAPKTYAQKSTAADFDHPSFDRPPHRPLTSLQPMIDETQVNINLDHVKLVPEMNAVPPPPSIELSAVPLADLATEMVWEACALGIAAMTQSRRATKPSAEQEIRSSPRVPEIYGAIGEGRTSKSLNSSSDSSPDTSSPATPIGNQATEAAAARRQRLAELGLGFPSKSSDDLSRDSRLHSPIESLRLQARKLSPTNFVAPGQNQFSVQSEPSGAFRQFVGQVLTSTLVAPEDVVLALYYVARIPSTAIIPPSAQTEFKAAPFKIFLGALMLANKTLQDNSYRNETFAAVSGIPLKDVNELEIFVFGALDFDVAVKDAIWQNWLNVIADKINSGAGDFGDRAAVEIALYRLQICAQRQFNILPNSPTFSGYDSPELPPVSDQFLFSQQTKFSPRTPNQNFADRAALLSAIDFDASGPIESKVFDRNVVRCAPASPSQKFEWQEKNLFPVSETRFFPHQPQLAF